MLARLAEEEGVYPCILRISVISLSRTWVRYAGRILVLMVERDGS